MELDGPGLFKNVKNDKYDPVAQQVYIFWYGWNAGCVTSSPPTSGTFHPQNSILSGKSPSTLTVTFVHLPPGDGGQEVVQCSDRPLGRHSVRHQDGAVQVDVKHQLSPPRRIHERQPPRDIVCQRHRPGAVSPVTWVRPWVAVLPEVLHRSGATKLKLYAWCFPLTSLVWELDTGGIYRHFRQLPLFLLLLRLLFCVVKQRHLEL